MHRPHMVDPCVPSTRILVPPGGNMLQSLRVRLEFIRCNKEAGIPNLSDLSRGELVAWSKLLHGVSMSDGIEAIKLLTSANLPKDRPMYGGTPLTGRA